MAEGRWIKDDAGYILKSEYAPDGVVVTIYEDGETRRGKVRYRATMRNVKTGQRVISRRAWALAGAKRHGYMVAQSDLWLRQVGIETKPITPVKE